MPIKKIAFFTVILAACLWFLVYEFKREQPLPASPVEQNNEARETVSPKQIKAIYITAQTASRRSRTDELINLIKTTDLNALVITVKDSDGTYLNEGMARLVKQLREENIYPIARIVAFQDNALAKTRPDLALRNTAGNLWVGGAKYLWVDPASQEVWSRIVAVAQQALEMGFREINFDYIRFPSDGDVREIVFPIYDKQRSQEQVMRDFYAYLTKHLRQNQPEAILSIDVFAYSFLKNDGLGVGQRVGDAAAYFDVVSPMVYPSHYASGNFGFVNPAEEPYEVVRQTLEKGKALLAAASSTAIIRPWIQDFNIGADYNAQMVQEEMRAVRDAGFGNTWMVWNPSNIYEKEEFLELP